MVQTDVEESPTDVLSLTVAQRYSVLITARNDTTSNWVIHANMDTDMFDTIPDALNPSMSPFAPRSQASCLTINLADITSSITYNTSAPLQPAGTIDAYHDVDDVSLVPIPAEPQLPPATHTIPLLVVFDTATDGSNRAYFNSVTYNPPVVPAVFSALSLDSVVGPGSSDVASAYGPWNFVLNYGETVDLVVMNSDAGKHPL